MCSKRLQSIDLQTSEIHIGLPTEIGQSLRRFGERVSFD